MSKLTSFNIPTVDGILKANGYKVRLSVGDTKEWFVLQMDGSKPAILAHWASGYKIANLRAIALQAYVATGYFQNDALPYWRKFAQRKLDEIVAAKGQAETLAIMRKPERINK